ncbi:MAG: tryptophan synthase subunit alpha [Gammaproteobacteria bacterium]
MSRIEACFSLLRGASRKALIPFITAGDPAPAYTVPLMHALVQAGADLIELGVPFSDPMADGPVIQRASERALRYDVSLGDVLDMVKAFREANTSTPVVLMGYLNPFEIMGYQAFAQDAHSAGVDGVLTVDLPPEEAAELSAALRGYHIDPVFLIAPTTSDERKLRICRAASGFLYYVSLKGVTGSDKLESSALSAQIEKIRQSTDLPIAIGFGIKDARSAVRVAALGDAVVVGSALVAKLAERERDIEHCADEARSVLKDIRLALDSAYAADVGGAQ